MKQLEIGIYAYAYWHTYFKSERIRSVRRLATIRGVPPDIKKAALKYLYTQGECGHSHDHILNGKIKICTYCFLKDDIRNEIIATYNGGSDD